MVYRDNVFHVNRRYKDTTFFQCADYKKHKCTCRVIITEGGDMKVGKKTHTHPPNIERVKKNMANMTNVTRSKYNLMNDELSKV